MGTVLLRRFVVVVVESAPPFVPLPFEPWGRKGRQWVELGRKALSLKDCASCGIHIEIMNVLWASC